MQEMIGIISFCMAVLGGLVSIWSKDVSRRTSAMSVGFIFLVAFLLIFFGRRVAGEETEFIRVTTCVVSFIVAVAGGVTAIFHEDKDRQLVSEVVGFVFLVTSFLLLW